MKDNSFQLFDEHNIGERDYDTCFEMHDGDLVVHGLIGLAKKNYWLKANLKKELGVTCYMEWGEVYGRIESIDAENKSYGLNGQLALGI